MLIQPFADERVSTCLSFEDVNSCNSSSLIEVCCTMERNQNLHQLCYWRTSRKGLFVTTAEVSAKCRWNVSDMSVICWWSNDWLSTEYRLTIDRLLSETDYWPHINWYSTDTRLVLDRQMSRTRSILNWQSTNTRPIYWLICQPRVNQHISPPLIRHKIHFFQVAHLLYLHKFCVEWKSCNSVL